MPKKEVQDYSKEVEEGVVKFTAVALEEKRLQEAIDGLLVLEKKCRVGEDHESGQKVAACLVKVCFESKDYESLKSNLLLLSKRRGQVFSFFFLFFFFFFSFFFLFFFFFFSFSFFFLFLFFFFFFFVTC